MLQYLDLKRHPTGDGGSRRSGFIQMMFFSPKARGKSIPRDQDAFYDQPHKFNLLISN